VTLHHIHVLDAHCQYVEIWLSEIQHIKTTHNPTNNKGTLRASNSKKHLLVTIFTNTIKTTCFDFRNVLEERKEFLTQLIAALPTDYSQLFAKHFRQTVCHTAPNPSNGRNSMAVGWMDGWMDGWM
jgi:hypothetical protein